MKKLMFAMVAMAAGISLADVSSANVVGYTGVSVIKDRYYMYATAFDGVSGVANDGIDIQKLIVGDIPYGTEIQIRQYGSDGYDVYRYVEEAYDEAKDDFYPGWADMDDYLVIRQVAPGTPFWFKTPSDCSFSVAGQILTDASKSYAIIANHYEMIANPYPVSMDPNAIEFTGLNYGDELQIRDAEGLGYSVLRYVEEAYDEEKDDFFPGWADMDDYLVKTPIFESARGAWMMTKGAVTVNFVSPVK